MSGWNSRNIWKCQKRWNNRKGMTMTEVIVAFAVLVLVLAMFSGCLLRAGKTAARIRSLQSLGQEWEKAYYLEQDSMRDEADTFFIEMTFAEQGGEDSFTVSAILRKMQTGSAVLYEVISPDEVSEDGE